MFLDHTQRRNTVGRTPLDEWSARCRELYLTTHDTLTTEKYPCPGGSRTQYLSRRAAAGRWGKAWQRPATTRPTTFHACKARGCQGSFRLLMMDAVSPETCWASYKYEIKFWYIVTSCCIFYMNYTMMYGSTNIKFIKICLLTFECVCIPRYGTAGPVA
jgi:hypothetical protein